MSKSNPCVILVEPQLAENVGMAARAMKNCALSELRLVNPREDHLSAKAISASSNSENILYSAKVFSSLEAAIADLQYVIATTARHRDQTKKVYNADSAAEELSLKCTQGKKCGIMFGPERTGLRNEDVSWADAIVNIPLNPEHCSLNLSKAVLLMGYEYYKTQLEDIQPFFETNHTQTATKEKVALFCHYLASIVDDFTNLNDEQKKGKLALNLRNIFTRSELTEQELNTLYGIIKHLRQTEK